MSIRRSILAATLLGSALTMAAPAFAATSFKGSGSSFIVNGNGAFFDTAIPSGLFTDTIDFSVNSPGVADVGVIYFNFVSGISNLSATFNGVPIVFKQTAGDLYSGGINAPIVPGLQTITVSGLSNGSSASYSGTVKFAAVPEAATWLMMIAGIGFAGFALRRRKVDYKVRYAF